jgi:hypothetical protein
VPSVNRPKAVPASGRRILPMTTWRRLLPLLFITLGACALRPSWHWEKPGAGEEAYDRDLTFCKLQTYSGTEGMVTNESVRRMQGCMVGRGWRKVDN